MAADPHHALGDCVDCDPGAPHQPTDCETDTCPGMIASCGSQHGVAMISAAVPGSEAMLRDPTRVDHGSDGYGPPPPSRIDRPPIA